MKTHFVMMAKYNAWANARLFGMAGALHEEQYRRDVGAYFKSLHGTLNHLLVAIEFVRSLDEAAFDEAWDYRMLNGTRCRGTRTIGSAHNAARQSKVSRILFLRVIYW